MIPPCKALLFDFDGTLVQSNQIKRDTLFVVARTVGASDDQLGQILNDHPRYDRFGLYRELLIRRGYEGALESKVLELSSLYGQLTTSAISQAPEIPGAEAFLIEYSSKIPMFINSATPEESLRNTVEARGWNGFFKGVYGRPKSKNEIVDVVQKETGLPADQILFVGDSLQDLESARDNECPFLGVAHEPGWHYAFPPDVAVLSHYKDFFKLTGWSSGE